MNLYNDIDSFSQRWLGKLIEQKLIPSGIVDGRSITDISGSELLGYNQVHFFAGIAGWSQALKLAGWPEDEPVWTGSCPCQPFSTAGKQKGFEDERHLWPEMRRLIDECRPTTIFGEQVASAPGRQWLSIVWSDLEALGYAVGCADLCGPCVGAPHIRQRLYWVGYSSSKPSQWNSRSVCSSETQEHSERKQNGKQYQRFEYASLGNRMGNAPSEGLEGANWVQETQRSEHSNTENRLANACEYGCGETGQGCTEEEWNGSLGAHWEHSEFIKCWDGKSRPVMPGVRLLAHGFPNRVGALRGFGNAIIPQVAALFIRSFIQSVTS